MSGERPEADDLGELYGALSREMILDADMSLSDIRLVAYIGVFDRRSLETGKGKGCIRSINNLARDLGMSKRQALRSLEKVVRKGYVRKTPRGQSWQGYVLQVVYGGGDTAFTTPGDTGVTTPDTAVTTPVTQESPDGVTGVTHKREGIDNLIEGDDAQPNNGLSGDDVTTVIKRWRDIAEPAGAAKAERLTAKRRSLIESAIAENGLSDVLAAIDRIAKSKWAMGGGERGWQATLKWVLAPGKPAEILDGEHDDFRPAGPQESGDGLTRAIMRRIRARNADTDNSGDDFTRGLHDDLGSYFGEESAPEPIAHYAEFSEVNDEGPPWP